MTPEVGLQSLGWECVLPSQTNSHLSSSQSAHQAIRAAFGAAPPFGARRSQHAKAQEEEAEGDCLLMIQNEHEHHEYSREPGR